MGPKKGDQGFSFGVGDRVGIKMAFTAPVVDPPAVAVPRRIGRADRRLAMAAGNIDDINGLTKP